MGAIIRRSPVRSKRLNFQERRKKEQDDMNNARRVLAFAQELNLAGVSQKARVRSIMLSHGLSAAEARVAIQLAKPRKHRRRS